MRLQPFGQTLPVHCCCEPGKRLGWVPVPERLMQGFPDSAGATRPVRFMAGHPTRDMLTEIVSMPEQLSTRIAWMMPANGDEPFLAVNSNDIPIEQWRKVPGFIEDRSRRGMLG